MFVQIENGNGVMLKITGHGKNTLTIRIQTKHHLTLMTLLVMANPIAIIANNG